MLRKWIIKTGLVIFFLGGVALSLVLGFEDNHSDRITHELQGIKYPQTIILKLNGKDIKIRIYAVKSIQTVNK